jgi:hypothetical protein
MSFGFKGLNNKIRCEKALKKKPSVWGAGCFELISERRSHHSSESLFSILNIDFLTARKKEM